MMTEYLLTVLIITICSLLHDGDYAPKWLVVTIHAVLVALLMDSWQVGVIASLLSIVTFWGIFRRGWQAKAELNALGDNGDMDAIVKAYPPYLGYVPKYITAQVVKLPYKKWHRRIQSGLIALLWTGHFSAIPILVGAF